MKLRTAKKILKNEAHGNISYRNTTFSKAMFTVEYIYFLKMFNVLLQRVT